MAIVTLSHKKVLIEGKDPSTNKKLKWAAKDSNEASENGALNAGLKHESQNAIMYSVDGWWTGNRDNVTEYPCKSLIDNMTEVSDISKLVVGHVVQYSSDGRIFSNFQKANELKSKGSSVSTGNC